MAIYERAEDKNNWGRTYKIFFSLKYEHKCITVCKHNFEISESRA